MQSFRPLPGFSVLLSSLGCGMYHFALIVKKADSYARSRFAPNGSE
jgi:hypothetical protein